MNAIAISFILAVVIAVILLGFEVAGLIAFGVGLTILVVGTLVFYMIFSLK